MNVLKPIALGLIVVGIAFGLAWKASSTKTMPPPPVSQETKAPTPGAVQTLSDVAKHASATSCWSAINGGVYDLTEWIGKHPGGKQAIVSICGKDASAVFNAQHGNAKLQQDILKGYKIGTLSK